MADDKIIIRDDDLNNEAPQGNSANPASIHISLEELTPPPLPTSNAAWDNASPVPPVGTYGQPFTPAPGGYAEQSPKSSLPWAAIIGGVALLLVIIFGTVFMLSGNSGDDDDSTGGKLTLTTAKIVQPPEDFVKLAKIITHELRPVSDLNLLETLPACVRRKLLEMEDFQPKDSQFSTIYEDGKQALQATEAALQKLESLPRPPGDEGALIAFVLGVLDGMAWAEGIPSGVSFKYSADAKAKQDAINAAHRETLRAMNRVESLASQFPKMAEKYAAKETENKGRIVVDYDEYLPGGLHFLYLQNRGNAIRNAMVITTIIGNEHVSRTSVCFIENWGQDSVASLCDTQYSIGKITTMYPVRQVKVKILSAEFSTSLTYDYSELERGKDHENLFRDIAFSGSWQPRAPGFISDWERSATITMSGIRCLPNHTISFEYVAGNSRKTHAWRVDEWNSGKSFLFEVGNSRLNFEPQVIHVSLTFPESTHVVKRSFRIQGKQLIPQ